MNTSLGIIYTEIGDNYVKATMPVNEKTIQPMGMLNGGASMALIETLGSMGANLVIDRNTHAAFGQSIQGSHIRPAFKGETVTGIAKPVHLGQKTQIWDVEIVNEQNKLVCKGSITMAVVEIRNAAI